MWQTLKTKSTIRGKVRCILGSPYMEIRPREKQNRFARAASG